MQIQSSHSVFVEGDLRHAFSFKNCSFAVRTFESVHNRIMCQSPKKREILCDVSANIVSGTDLAIMGPSGSGKSSLLNLLTLAATNGEIYGEVTINGHKISSKRFRKFCAYVPQEDHLCPFLKCREILEYAMDFYLPVEADTKAKRVDSLLKDLGLESCQNTFCGNQFLKGLSGGQKRRLSLAVALAKEPLILFLDEPTSGLDSAATSEIVAVLKKSNLKSKSLSSAPFTSRRLAYSTNSTPFCYFLVAE